MLGAYETGDDQPEPAQFDGEGGRTWDQKRDDLTALPDAGTCDIRHRGALEADLAKLASRPATAPITPWNRKTPLAYAALVRAALALTPAEEQQLARDGFVVPDRLAYDNYSAAFYDIHRGQLPVYVSADAILHSVYASHDELMEAHRARLASPPRSIRMLGALACGLPGVAADYPPEVARDLDVYLATARSLLAGNAVAPSLDPENAPIVAKKLVALITDAGPRTSVELFGRIRAIDPNLYTPRGHYADGWMMQNYFRAAMWISRIELNLVTHDTRSSDLDGNQAGDAARGRRRARARGSRRQDGRTPAPTSPTSSARGPLYAGKREDVAMSDLRALRAAAKIDKLTAPDAAAKLRAAIGNRFHRTINTHPNPNVTNLPVIASLLGPRITTSAAAVSSIVSRPRPRHRRPPSSASCSASIAARSTATRRSRRSSRARRRSSRRSRATISTRRGSPRSARTARCRPAPCRRSWTARRSPICGSTRRSSRSASSRTTTCSSRRRSTTRAAARFRTATSSRRCRCTARSRPTPSAARRCTRSSIRSTRPARAATSSALRAVADTLAGIATEELAGHALSDDAKRFLAMIVEMREATAMTYMDTYPIPTFDGWYIDLFPSLDTAFHPAAFVADYLTYDRNGHAGVKYIAATGPRLGVFAVDTGGGPRMMVGPVAHGFQATGPIAKRFTDEDAVALAARSSSRRGPRATGRRGQAAPSFAISIIDRPRKERQEARPAHPPPG